MVGGIVSPRPGRGWHGSAAVGRGTSVVPSRWVVRASRRSCASAPALWSGLNVQC